MSTFSDLDEVHQAVLITASEEGLPWEVAAEWSKDPEKRTTADIEQSRLAAAEFIHRGLIWMVDYEASNRELTQDEVDAVLEGDRPWTYGSDVPHNIALYLTESGEELYFGG